MRESVAAAVEPPLLTSLAMGGETSFLHVFFKFLAERLKVIRYMSEQGGHTLQVLAAVIHDHKKI